MDKTQKTEEKIQHVLDEKINNRLADHGGSAELTGFVDGVASVKFYGACGHCASADDTFQFIVKSSILEEVPEAQNQYGRQNHNTGYNFLLLAEHIFTSYHRNCILAHIRY